MKGGAVLTWVLMYLLADHGDWLKKKILVLGPMRPSSPDFNSSQSQMLFGHQ